MKIKPKLKWLNTIHTRTSRNNICAKSPTSFYEQIIIMSKLPLNYQIKTLTLTDTKKD